MFFREFCGVVFLTCFSPMAPLLYVDANVELQASLYHGALPCSVTLDIDKLYTEFVYPSQLQLSCSLPPLPDAQINIDPFPLRPCKKKIWIFFCGNLMC